MRINKIFVYLKKITSDRMDGRILLKLLILWLICILNAFLWFYIRYRQLPNVYEAILYMNVNIFSLPKSFFDFFKITSKTSPVGTLRATISFWFIVVFLLRNLLKKRLIVFFILMAIILILASFNWLIVAIGMSRI